MSHNKPPMKLLYWDHGILNDIKLERIKKSGLLLNSKKRTSHSIKVANSWRSQIDNFTKLNTLMGKNVKRLEVYYDIVTRKQVENFCSYIQKTSDLEALTLNFKASPEFGDAELIDIAHTLKSLNNLVSLDIEIVKPVRVSDKGFYIFGAELANLKSLRSFRFSIDLMQISDKSLIKFAKSISRLREIRNLDLEFIRFQNITDKSLQVLANSTLNLTNLESFALDVSWCLQITDHSVVKLSEALGYLPKIKNYKFTCRRCQVTNLSIDAIVIMIHNLSELTNFFLDMYGCAGITEDKLVHLFKGFSKLTNLELSNMYLGPGSEGQNSLGDNGMLYLGRAISELTKLKEFRLTLCEFPTLTDEGINSFGQVVSQMGSINTIELRFSGCRAINRSGIDELGVQLSKNPNISNIILRQ